jgi:hypothetical protein
VDVGASVGVLAGVKEALSDGVGVMIGVDVDVRAGSEVLVGVGVKVGAGVTVAASSRGAEVSVIDGVSSPTEVVVDPLVSAAQPTLKPKDRRRSSIRQYFIPSLFPPFMRKSAINL